ncbi:MAG: valine--tRNA ligase [Chloroflexota bacterium]
MSKEFPKAWQPASSEKKWYEKWLESRVFSIHKAERKPYSILMPPPNVTGILHFGHVLNISLQDLYIRYNKMKGADSLWFPGIDHAGIATQAKVEGELRKEKVSRHDLGREKFVERVWDWKEKYGGIILRQVRELGAACDWEKTLFTMDDSASNAVKEVFIKLFDEGLIYRGKRIINWSPLAMTALSDEEVEFREVKEHLFTLRYHLEDGSGYLKVATVRPETIFGDTAVAVNPHDERYKALIGKRVRVPLTNRFVKIIGDEYADPTFGTGCVKITPAHDPNDFLVGGRHNLEIINTINPDGTLNELTGEFDKIERFEARKKILAKLEAEDLIEAIEDYVHNVGFSQRHGEPVEPYLSDQWFVNMKPLAKEALDCVLNGDVKFHPNHWVRTYEHWMTGIRDWCISRQLWWGHRIPVYYTVDGTFTAARDAAHALEKLGLPPGTPLEQDTDVLDTWFSSWLWPMTTMGWDGTNEPTNDMKKYLPTDLLVTAPDIIFFWVARMIIATKKFAGTIPFKDVYFTSTIRDGKGRKLSKSLGNSPDPLNIIDKYGADSVRFTMLFLSPLGQDVRMNVDVEKQDIPSMELGRNFANKIWNAGRFILMKRDEFGSQNVDFCKSFADVWIESRLNSTIVKLEETLSSFRVTEFAKLLYDFIWRDYCDWYVEILKIELANETDPEKKSALVGFAVEIYEKILKLLHPVMPFITEEIYHLTADRPEDQYIGEESYPEANESAIKPETEEGFEFIQNVVEEIRKLRATASLPPSKKLPVVIKSPTERDAAFISSQSAIIRSLAKASELDVAIDVEKPEKALTSVYRENEIFIAAEEAIDVDKELERLAKEIKRLEGNIMGSDKKLSNEKFVAGAPADIVAYEREKLESMKQTLEKLRENYTSLGGK